MKFRTAAVSAVVAMALVAAGCGSDSDSKAEKDDDAGTDKKEKKLSESEQVVESKKSAVEDARKAFEENPRDAAVCRDLGMKLVALASPESTGDPKKQPEIPKDRDENLGKAVETYEECIAIAPRDRDIQSSLASTYMATSKYDKVAPMLEELAKSAKGAERANAFYAWGLAASNAQDTDSAIEAWSQFAKLAEPSDPRVKQVNQSIAALREAKRNPPPTTPAPEGEPADADDSQDGEGEEGGEGEGGEENADADADASGDESDAEGADNEE